MIKYSLMNNDICECGIDKSTQYSCPFMSFETCINHKVLTTTSKSHYFYSGSSWFPTAAINIQWRTLLQMKKVGSFCCMCEWGAVQGSYWEELARGVLRICPEVLVRENRSLCDAYVCPSVSMCVLTDSSVM